MSKRDLFLKQGRENAFEEIRQRIIKTIKQPEECRNRLRELKSIEDKIEGNCSFSWSHIQDLLDEPVPEWKKLSDRNQIRILKKLIKITGKSQDPMQHMLRFTDNELMFIIDEFKDEMQSVFTDPTLVFCHINNESKCAYILQHYKLDDDYTVNAMESFPSWKKNLVEDWLIQKIQGMKSDEGTKQYLEWLNLFTFENEKLVKLISDK